MYQLSLRFAWIVFFLLCLPAFARAPSPFTLATMPRVDVHAHIRDKWEVIDAHMLWLCYSDEQLDYLRYMLTTYPNLNVDIATVPEFTYHVDRENLRDFMIEYSDRVLFGTDMGTKWFAPDLGGAADNFKTRTGNYKRYFDFLETDKVLPSDFVDVTKGQGGVRMGAKGERTIQGLALPTEVLEKIYFRNAMRIYPHVKANLKKLGYPVE